MRVPNTGLDPELRAIVREGYRLAERLMRDYRDPAGLMQRAALLLGGTRRALETFARDLTRG